MIRALAIIATLAAALAASCIRDSYECRTDGDCTIGTAGRCEIDNRCTEYDASCPTLRRYTRHSGDESNVCFAGQIDLVNPCAAGQPPANPVGSANACAATVCEQLPTCCAAGWSEPCVLAAQRACAIQCDTRIAISAVHGSATELWDLRFDGENFTATSLEDRYEQASWLAPAPGSAEPRLASFAGSGTLAITSSTGEVDLAVDPAKAFHDLASVDFDRDLRDTIALEWKGADEEIDVVKLATGDVRSFPVAVSSRGTWGDLDQDSFPDAVSGTAAHYTFLVNDQDDSDDHGRTLVADGTSSFNGSASSGFVSLRDLAFTDADGDQYPDLVAFGNSIRVHQGGPFITDNPFVAIDCDPPIVLGTDTCANANWVGALVPGPIGAGAAIYAANTIVNEEIGTGSDAIGSGAGRTFYRFDLTGDTATIKTTALDVPGLTGPTSAATGGGSGSAVAAAVITRDLDGDHILDVVVIDSLLGVWTALSTKDPTLTTFTHSTPILMTTYQHSQVHTSVTGQLR